MGRAGPAEACGQRWGGILSLGRARAVPHHAQVSLDATDLDDLGASLLAWLIHALLDDGVRDAETVAADVLSRAMARTGDEPWV